MKAVTYRTISTVKQVDDAKLEKKDDIYCKNYFTLFGF